MKATSLKEYQTKFQPDTSLNMETAWAGSKKTNNILEICAFLSAKFPNRVTGLAEILFGIPL
jgi:hypothetical protein